MQGTVTDNIVAALICIRLEYRPTQLNLTSNFGVMTTQLHKVSKARMLLTILNVPSNKTRHK